MRISEARLLALVVLDISHSDLRSVDPNHLTTPEGEPGGGQHQEKFLRLQHVGRSVDLEFGAACRGIEQEAASAPCAVNGHQIDAMSVVKSNTRGSPILSPHARPPVAATALSFEPAAAAGGSKRI